MLENAINPILAWQIRVPASTSNLGSAFDAAGLALQLYLTVEIRKLEGGSSSLEYRGQNPQLIPSDASNLIWRVMEEVAAARNRSLPTFSLRIANEIPIARGLGSSASACLAGAAAAGLLCELRFTPSDLLEIVVAREGHPDNAAPSLLGGLVTSISGSRVLCSRSEFPKNWTVVTVTPDYPLETKYARAVLPRQVSHRDAVFNVQRAAFLMAQLAQGRREGIREAMNDRLHQPYRSSLIPGFNEILALEDCDGLIGVALSGAGSSVVAFVDSNEEENGNRIRRIFEQHGLPAQVRLLKADNEGLTIREM